MNMSSRYRIFLPFVIFLLALAGCASARVVSSSGGPGIAQAQQAAYNGPKQRIAVKAFEYKAARGSRDIGNGMSDMLADSLFNSGRFIVLEREHIKEVMEEQDFGASGRVKKDTAEAQSRPPTEADVMEFHNRLLRNLSRPWHR